MGQYPVPSISWKKCRHVHFEWRYGKGDTACGMKIPRYARRDRTPDRPITCKKCLYQIYDIPYTSGKANAKKFRNF